MSSPSRQEKTVTLDHLIALSDEMAALIRAGIPLEQGLAQVGSDLPGRLRHTALSLGKRLEEGHSLAEAVASHAGGFPPLYAAVIEAGIRSGRPAAALESLAAWARRVAQLRRLAAQALVYPLIVLLLAYLLIVFFAVHTAPTVASFFISFKAPFASWLTSLAEAGRTAAWWAPIFPSVLFLFLAAWWFASGRAMAMRPSWAGACIAWIPAMRPLLRHSQTALFADLLAMLVEHQVPLPEALRLAAGATLNRPLAAKGAQVAEAVAQGQPLAQACSAAALFPPMLCWLMTAASSRGLAAALRHAADMYARKAARRAEAARVYLPVALTIGLAGSATLTYAVLVFVPWISTLRWLAIGLNEGSPGA